MVIARAAEGRDASAKSVWASRFFRSYMCAYGYRGEWCLLKINYFEGHSYMWIIIKQWTTMLAHGCVMVLHESLIWWCDSNQTNRVFHLSMQSQARPSSDSNQSNRVFHLSMQSQTRPSRSHCWLGWAIFFMNCWIALIIAVCILDPTDKGE